MTPSEPTRLSAPERRVLGWLLALAAVVRGSYIAYFGRLVRNAEPILFDSFWYRTQAYAVAHGNLFERVDIFRPSVAGGPTAEHPPLTSLLLAPVARVFGSGRMPMTIAVACVGIVNVALVFVLARRVGGRRAAYWAGAIAALYPFIWINDTLVMSETFASTIVLVLLLLVMRPTPPNPTRWAALLGFVCALGALTRSEFLLLVPLVALPALIAANRRSPIGLGRCLVVLALVFGAVVGPWVAYNLSRFERPVFITTSGEQNLLGGSCDDAFYGWKTGLLGFCVPYPYPTGEPSVVAAQFRAKAIDYTRHHEGRYLVVVLARAGRDWSLFRPADMVSLNVTEGRPRWVTISGLVWYYPLLVAAIVGAVLLRRRRAQLWPLLSIPLVVTLTAFVSWGQIRYRSYAEPVLVVLAAVALSSIRRRRETTLRDDETTALAEVRP